MTDQERGLYNKYYVERTDGDPEGKHKNCKYFVLDLNHDDHAIRALRAYAMSCREEYPLLFKDLLDIVVKREQEQMDAYDKS